MFVQKIYRRIGLLLFIIAFTTSIIQTTMGVNKFFPLEKIRPGMKGYGYTVFSGTKIEKFGIQVIGITDKSMGKDKLILVKLSGKLLEENGGLSAGMSGSPVYIHNQLVGAISYGFENADSFLAFVTPIDSMLKMKESNEDTFYLPAYHQRAIPVSTPIIISGMKKRGFDLLSRSLKMYGFQTVAGFDTGETTLDMGKNLIKPGSAISVMMVTGDYQVSALGTVTWVDGKDFWAFGHSYNNKGKVDYFAYQASILKTVHSSQMAFKLGIPLKLIGRITEDRQSGIFGKLEETPAYIPVQLSIRDNERNRIRQSIFYVQSNEQMARDLIIAGVTDAIDQTVDRVGPGTANVYIEAFPASGERIDQQNLFYSKDVATACTKDLNDLLTLIAGNDFVTIPLKKISVSIELSTKQTTARIVRISSETTKVKPGDVIRTSVLLHRYRGDNLTVPLDIKVPLNVKPGKLTLTVSGGSRESADAQEDEDKKEPFKLNYKGTSSFADLLKNYLVRPKNNELVIDYDPKPDEAENSDKSLLKSSTQFFLLGEAQLVVEVQQ